MRRFPWLLFGLLGCVSVAFGDEPTGRGKLKPLDLPPSIEVKTKPLDDKSAKETLQNALDGKSVQSGGMLHDVIEVIEQRGSILDGSVLDEDPPSLQTRQPVSDAVDQRFLVAESLLRTARRLESLDAKQHQDRKLIREMRLRAISLLQAALR